IVAGVARKRGRGRNTSSGIAADDGAILHACIAWTGSTACRLAAWVRWVRVNEDRKVIRSIRIRSVQSAHTGDEQFRAARIESVEQSLTAHDGCALRAVISLPGIKLIKHGKIERETTEVDTTIGGTKNRQIALQNVVDTVVTVWPIGAAWPNG